LKTLKMKKKTAVAFLAIVFCSTIVVISTVGSTFGIGNSFAEGQQIQTQSPSTITYKQSPLTITYKQSPWDNNLPNAVNKGQPLCQAGICSQSSDPANTTQHNNPQSAVISPTTQTKNVDPTSKTLTQTFTNAKTPTLNHSFQSDITAGPDTFRFINSFWTPTTKFTFPSLPVGTGNCWSTSGSFAASIAENNLANSVVNGNNNATHGAAGAASVIAAASGYPYPFLSGAAGYPYTAGYKESGEYPYAETTSGDTATLAVLLQYQGVVSVGGLSAALKLPSGFQTWGQGYDGNYNFAFSSYGRQVHPNDAIVLCFGPLKILPKAKPLIPYLGMLGLRYFTGCGQTVDGCGAPEGRTITDSIDAQQLLSAMRTLKLTSGLNMTTFTNSFNPNATPPTVEFKDTFTRNLPFDYIVNQFTPVIFQISGRAGPVDTQLNPDGTNPLHADALACNTPKPYTLSFTNTGDVPVGNLIAEVSTTVPVLGPYWSGLATPFVPPSGVSPLLAGTLVGQAATPLSVVGASTFNLGTLGPGSTKSTPPANKHLSGSFTGSIGSAGLILRSSAPCGPTGAAGNVITNPPLYITQTYTNAIGQRITEVKQLNVPVS
jgi:hypothetical protein